MEDDMTEIGGENAATPACVPRARAEPPAGWIVPKHGNGTLRPFTPGTGAAAARSSIRAIKREALAILAEGTPAASRRLLDLLDSEDPRVQAVAASQVLDRVLGKPSELSQVADETRQSSVSLLHLTPAERERLGAALAVVHELAALARSRADAAEGASQ